MHDASSRPKSRIEFDKIKMIDKLALEKNEFEMKLAEFGQRVKQAQADDYEKEANSGNCQWHPGFYPGGQGRSKRLMIGNRCSGSLHRILELDVAENWPRTGTWN